MSVEQAPLPKVESAMIEKQNSESKPTRENSNDKYDDLEVPKLNKSDDFLFDKDPEDLKEISEMFSDIQIKPPSCYSSNTASTVQGTPPSTQFTLKGQETQHLQGPHNQQHLQDFFDFNSFTSLDKNQPPKQETPPKSAPEDSFLKEFFESKPVNAHLPKLQEIPINQNAFQTNPLLQQQVFPQMFAQQQFMTNQQMLFHRANSLP